MPLFTMLINAKTYFPNAEAVLPYNDFRSSQKISKEDFF